MSVYCGDCGGETSRKGGSRICSTCRTWTAGTVTGRIPSKAPNRAAAPRPNNYPERELQFTGGGAHGACLTCGCAREECECPSS